MSSRQTTEAQVSCDMMMRRYKERGSMLPFVRNLDNVTWRRVAIVLALLLSLAAGWIVPHALEPRLGTLTTQSAAPWPDASLMVMGDWANRDWATERPQWGHVGSWAYWGWSELVNDPGIIDRYLATADAYGKRTAISVMIYPDIGRDSTPARVYAALGRTAGWTLTANDGRTTTCPLYGDAGWESAYAQFVTSLGTKYNADPRVHSVWIATGIYGETVISKDGYTLPAYYFRRWVVRAMDVYREAFPDKPLFIMLSTTDRAYYVSEAAARGIGIKLNTLLPDPSNAILKDGNGQTEAAMAAMAAGLPVAYEHAMGASQPDVYWAMLYALTWGARVIDLPTDRLDTLAALKTPWQEPMWDFALRMMRDDDALFWVARQARTPYQSGMWEGGWSGSWERGITLAGGDVTLCAQGATCWSQAPAELRTLYGVWGIGRWSGELLFDVSPEWYADRVRVRAVVSGPATLRYGAQEDSVTGAGWQVLEVTEHSWFGGAFELDCADCWLHMVYVEPVSDVETATPTYEPPATLTPVPTIPAPTATATPNWSVLWQETRDELLSLDRRMRELEEIIEKIKEALK